MFSNTMEYALESCIASFNQYLKNRTNYIGYSDTDLRNAFIQRYKSAMKSLPDKTMYVHFQPSNLGKFQIEGDTLVGLEFVKSVRWNAIGDQNIVELNKALANLNLIEIGENKLHIVCLEELCTNQIESINNYKIKI